VTAQTKEKLVDAARLSGRTQSQEAEYRIQRSFDQDELLAEMRQQIEATLRKAR
jgi:TraY domain